MSRNQPNPDPHIFEFEFPGGRIFEVEAAPDQQAQALATAKDFWNREQSQRTSALQESSKSEYRPGGFTGADFQNPVQRALNPVIDALHPFTLLELPKTLSSIAGYVGNIGEQAEQGIASGVQRVLGGDIAGGIGQGVGSTISAGTQIPADITRGVGSELSQSYQSAKEGDIAGAGVRAGMTIAPFIKPLATGIRAGVGAGASGVADIGTGIRRGGRQAAGFVEKPLIEPPDAIFQRATGIDPDYVPGAMDMLAEHKLRTGQVPRSHPELEQAIKSDRAYLTKYREDFLKPQQNLIAPDAHLDIYRRKVAAVPETLRQDNFELWESTMRKLQREFEQGPLTIRQLNKFRQELADSGLSRDPYAASTAEGSLKVALDDAWANAVRDNLYDFLDQRGKNHGSLLREINDRIDDNMMLTKNLEKNKTKSFLESRESKMDVLKEVPGKVASLTGFGGQGAFKTKFNEGIYDAIQRWTPQRGPLPANPFQPYNITAPIGPPPPLVGSYGTRSRVPPLAPGVTLPPGTDPVTGLRTAPPPLVNPTYILKPKPPK